MKSVLPIVFILLYLAAIFATDPQYDQIISKDVVHFQVNEPIKITCKNTGLGDRCIEWLKNGAILLASDRFVFGTCGNQYTLSIKKAVREDVGIYTCGVLESIHLQNFNKVALITDLRVDLPEEEIVYAGWDLNIQCKVTGIPTPTIYWRHNSQNVSVTITTSGGRYILSTLNGTKNSKLLIRSITKEEAGNLTCVVESPYLTRVTETSCTVYVPEPLSSCWGIIIIVICCGMCLLVVWKTKDKCKMNPRNRSPSPVQAISFPDSTSSSDEEFMERNKEKIASTRRALAIEKLYRESNKVKKEPDADSGLVNLSVDGGNSGSDE